MGRDQQHKFLSVVLLLLHNSSLYDICVAGPVYPNHRVHRIHPRVTMDHNQCQLTKSKVIFVANRALKMQKYAYL